MHLYLQIGSLLYLGLIAIIYFRKKSIKTIENKSFRVILLFTIITLVMDIISTEYNIGFGGGKYAGLLFKLFLFPLVGYVFAFTFYVFSISTKYHVENIEFKDHPHKKKITQALVKKAIGFETVETVEEFAETDGEVKLLKRKVTTKSVPPDVSAVKLLLEMQSEERDIVDMTDEELEKERVRLMKLLEEKKK